MNNYERIKAISIDEIAKMNMTYINNILKAKLKMNKPIIIDGVDVSECCFFEKHHHESADEDDCVIDIDNYCHLTWAECNDLCYYKQLQRSEQENLRLEAENKKLIEENYELSVNQEDIEQYKTIIHNKNIDIQRLKAENERLKAPSMIIPQVGKLGVPIEQYCKLKQALEEVREIAKLIKKDNDKPACVYDEGCPLNGGAGFDNHCNMTCPYVLAKIIDDKINEVLKDESN